MRILFCGLSGIPNKYSASINRYLAIAQAMAKDNEVIFLNRFPLYDESSINSKEQNIKFKIIDATGIKYRPQSFIKRNFIKVTSYLYEYVTLRRINKQKKIDWLNVYTQYFGIVLFYFLLSKIFNYKVILHYVEFRSHIKNRNFLYRINDYLFDNYAAFLCDKLIPISIYLNDHILKLKHDASTIIIPPICDFKHFSTIEPEYFNQKYFVYCGSAAYEEVLLFIIESFLKMSKRDEVQLHLVINGNITNQTIKYLIDTNSNSILIFSNLGYDTLIAKYKGSIAQLIPLRKSIQDYARFPQKICEYLASNRPILTTNFGEIPYYFKDNQDAIISEDYNLIDFSKKMEWAINNLDKLDAISEKSFDVGWSLFNIDSYISKLDHFLKS